VGAELERLASRVFELGAHVGGDEVAALDSLEAVSFEDLDVLCFQQSPGYSAGPEIDVAPAFLADRLLDRHVGELDPSAWPEHAKKS